MYDVCVGLCMSFIFFPVSLVSSCLVLAFRAAANK